MDTEKKKIATPIASKHYFDGNQQKREREKERERKDFLHRKDDRYLAGG